MTSSEITIRWNFPRTRWAWSAMKLVVIARLGISPDGGTERLTVVGRFPRWPWLHFSRGVK